MTTTRALLVGAAMLTLAACGSAVPVTGLTAAAPRTPCAAAIPQNEKDSFDEQVTLITAPSGLKYADIRVGCGAPVQKGHQVTVQYTGWLMDGTQFDTSRAQGRMPFTFLVGASEVIPGFEDGIYGMHVGGKRRVVMPPAMAYGSQGRAPVIPPNATLVVDVEVIAVQ
ncbi:MAG: FKBP-type peptidyl-prolyl cis-trans isomerase [Candidatus Dormibacteraeota bacterium]|nr:FKBP-type peptidyl-prolyl cis-trans isomerase [Candidatus Dormibacteraeota bacterium]MBV9525103.1 FKBP-type peptidyl-prolyl cis-trans isomerase [Candidatus Dormibacteraeota bacterium]